jgi:urease accessory protein
MAFVYVQNPTGAIFAADELSTKVSVGTGGAVHMTTQSATKIYSGAARQHYEYSIGPGALVESLPDPLIPYAGANYDQNTAVNMSADSTFINVETILPGRVTYGEEFAYDLVSVGTSVEIEGELVCRDIIHLEPSLVHPRSNAILCGTRSVTSLLIVSPWANVSELAEKLVDASLKLAPLAANGGDVNVGVSPLPHNAGCSVRILTQDPKDTRQAINAMWRVARSALFNIPIPRIRK